MNEIEFIEEISVLLKANGYRKHGKYWYRDRHSFKYCVCVYGSVWDSNNYYVEIGIDISDTKYPTLLYWALRTRCKNIYYDNSINATDNDLNIPPKALLDSLSLLEKAFSDIDDYQTVLNSTLACKVGMQYHIIDLRELANLLIQKRRKNESQ